MAKKDIWEGLGELFDMNDFAVLLRSAPDSIRLNAYLQIVKLLTYRSKTAASPADDEETKKLIDDLFKPSNG